MSKMDIFCHRSSPHADGSGVPAKEPAEVTHHLCRHRAKRDCPLFTESPLPLNESSLFFLQIGHRKAVNPAQDINRRRIAATAAKTSTDCPSMVTLPARCDTAGTARREKALLRVFRFGTGRVAPCQGTPQGARVSVCQGHARPGPADPLPQLNRPPRIGVVVSGRDRQGAPRA